MRNITLLAIIALFNTSLTSIDIQGDTDGRWEESKAETPISTRYLSPAKDRCITNPAAIAALKKYSKLAKIKLALDQKYSSDFTNLLSASDRYKANRTWICRIKIFIANEKCNRSRRAIDQSNVWRELDHLYSEISDLLSSEGFHNQFNHKDILEQAYYAEPVLSVNTCIRNHYGRKAK